MLASHGNDHKKFVFIHIQKTGGSSIEEVLWSTVPGLTRHRPRHMGARYARKRLDGWNEYYRFGFVRNPWDRLVSWYVMADDWRKARAAGTLREGRCRQLDNNPLLRQIMENGPTFEAFVKRCTKEVRNKGAIYSFTRNQVEYLTDKNGNLLVDFVGRFERLEADVAAVFAEIGLGKSELPHTNKSEHGHYSEFYTPETAQIVAERFAKDIEFFGYEFGGFIDRPRTADNS